MSTALLPVWSQIEWYLDNGFSIVPCYDQNAEDKSKIKKPCIKWKEYQSKIIDRSLLFELMDVKYNTTAISIIAGKISGNFECIDVDLKNWAGIDAIFFTQIQSLYPDLWNRLRIHKTPSGGYHILYRISDHEVEGNKKLCHKQGVKLAAIETRGEGGYLLAPPSMGYVIYKDNPIPSITWAERCSLFAIAESFDEANLMAQKQVSASKYDESYYDENPFEHFNRSNAAMDVLGWRVIKENTKFIWYEKPREKSTSQVGASFNKEKRVYYIFTTSTEFEGSRGYLPATVLSILKFGGDHKKTYKYLVEQGYGKIKPDTEKKIAKKAAINNKPLPSNFSEEGRNFHVDISGQLLAAHPFGIFWYEEESEYKIDREKLYSVCDGLGFRLYNTNLVMVEDERYIIEVDDRLFFDTVKNYIKEDDADARNLILNTYESFIERHGRFTISRLPIILDSFILQDGRDVCYKFYQNCFIEITAYKIQQRNYDSLTHYVWKKSIQPRNWSGNAGGRYPEFLKLAIGELTDYVKKCIGYLAHQFKDETTGYIVTLTEQCENPEDGGGSGKNVFCNLFKYTTTFTSKPGSQVKFDEKFMQSWNGEKIFCISDAPKNFDFGFLKELSTGDGLVKKLFKDEYSVSSEMMPRFLIQTNYSYEIKDGGIRRRVMPIEFTDFFTRTGGIDVHFGVHFPKGWDYNDWSGYDCFIAECVQCWLSGNLKLHAPGLTEGGWYKQFEMSYGPIIHGFIKENIDQWTKEIWVSLDKFNEQLLRYYNENSIAPHFRPSVIRINRGIKNYCGHINIEFNASVARRENAIVQKFKFFAKRDQETPF